MSIGSNIREYRLKSKMTQEALAERLNVSFQAISSWERDEYLPSIDNLMKLAEVLDIKVSFLLDEKVFKEEKNDALFNYEHMKTYIKQAAKHYNLENTLKALDFSFKAHNGQKRKKSDIPYIYHPLSLACHLLAMNIIDDEVISASLLHDVIEDCGVLASDLPVNDNIKELVLLLSHDKTNDKTREEVMNKYYDNIKNNPKAALIKVLDRCNNLTSMVYGLKKDRMIRMIKETEKYYPILLDVLKNTKEYNNAYWLLKYQIYSMLDIYKGLL